MMVSVEGEEKYMWVLHIFQREKARLEASEFLKHYVELRSACCCDTISGLVDSDLLDLRPACCMYTCGAD